MGFGPGVCAMQAELRVKGSDRPGPLSCRNSYILPLAAAGLWSQARVQSFERTIARIHIRRAPSHITSGLPLGSLELSWLCGSVLPPRCRESRPGADCHSLEQQIPERHSDCLKPPHIGQDSPVLIASSLHGTSTLAVFAELAGSYMLREYVRTSAAIPFLLKLLNLLNSTNRRPPI